MAQVERTPGTPRRATAGKTLPPEERSPIAEANTADWHRRVVDRSLGSATRKSIDRGARFIQAAMALLERSHGDGFTVQEVADEAGQSLRTLYQYFESKDDLLLAVFEEAMRTYAQLVRDTTVAFDDPLERLAAGVIASVRMPEVSRASVDVGLAQIRVTLGQVEPALVGRSQEPVVSLFRELYRAAEATGRIGDIGEDGAVYMIVALNSAYVTSQTLGNEYGVQLPDHEAHARFCLQGLGAQLDDDWFASVSRRIDLPPQRTSS